MPFIKCPECGKLNSVKLKNCPKCEASLDIARASYNTPDTHQPATGATAQPQSTPWGQPAQQTAPQPPSNPWGQPAQQSVPQPPSNPWGQPAQHTAAQPQSNPWGQPAQQTVQSGTRCSACGNMLAPGARFCPKCGHQVSTIPTRKNPYLI